MAQVQAERTTSSAGLLSRTAVLHALALQALVGRCPVHVNGAYAAAPAASASAPSVE